MDISLLDSVLEVMLPFYIFFFLTIYFNDFIDAFRTCKGLHAQVTASNIVGGLRGKVNCSYELDRGKNSTLNS